MLNLALPWRTSPRISPRTAPGASPGTLVSDPTAERPVVRVIAYDSERLIEETVESLDAVRDLRESWTRVWVNVDGLGDADTIGAIGELFGLHPLALEDVANANQRPKLEEYSGHLFVLTRMPQLDEEAFRSEQLSLFLGEGFVVTFQERAGDCFEPVRKRLRENPRERFLDPAYLAYALLDAIVDSYFPVLEAFTERLDLLEDKIALRPTADLLGEIFDTKHVLFSLRRSIWPMRDVLNSLVRDPQPLLSDMTRIYLRDCYDHAVRIIDLVETYRELSAGLMEFYQSSVGHRMNEVMKVLTVMATIFIPLTFIAGIYGMNFDPQASPWNLPELDWYWGYPAVLLLMGLTAVGMIVYFRRKGWIG